MHHTAFSVYLFLLHNFRYFPPPYGFQPQILSVLGLSFSNGNGNYDDDDDDGYGLTKHDDDTTLTERQNL